MAFSLDPVRHALAACLAGGPFRPLWAIVTDAAPRVDADPQVSEDERDAFDELYNLAPVAPAPDLPGRGRRPGARA